MPSPKTNFLVINTRTNDVEIFPSLEEVRNYLTDDIVKGNIDEHEVDEIYQVYEMKRQLVIDVEKKVSVSLR